MAGALKSSSMIPPEFFGGEGTEYADKYKTAQEAEDRLMMMLQNRRTGMGEDGGFRFDPKMLALTGELLDPGRTGSFGEALGRGAKAYSAAQMAEEKRDIEDAMMQMQMSQIPLDRARRAQAFKQFQTLQGGVTPEGGVGPVKGDASGPAMMVQGRMVTPAMIAQAKLIDPSLGEALETEYKLRIETMGSQPSGTFNKLTGEFKPFPGRGMEKEFVPELKGTIEMSPEDVVAIRAARDAGNADAVYKIIDKYEKGVGPRGAGAAPEVAPSDITVSGREARSAAEKETATVLAKEQAEATNKFLMQADEHRVSRAGAAQNLEIVRRNPKIFGFFNQKGWGPAFLGLAQESADSHVKSGTSGVDVNVSKADLQKLLMKLDIAPGSKRAKELKFTDQDFTDLDVFAGNLARMELGLRRQTYAGSGMGSLSNLEGQPIKDVLGSRYDSPEAIKQKMAMVARGFDLDMDIAAAFRDYRNKPGNQYKTLEQFKGDKEDGRYARLIEGAERWANQNLGIPFRRKETGEAPPAKPEPRMAGSRTGELVTAAGEEGVPPKSSKPPKNKPIRPLTTQSVQDAIDRLDKEGKLK
jgi:hypothetical protein